MQDAAAGQTLTQLILGGSVATQAVLVICGLFSVMSWYVIAAKWWAFRRLARERREFDRALDRARTMEGREQAMAGLGDSPYAAIVRATGSFMGDIRASMQRDNVTRSGLSLTQLEALSMTLETEVGEEVEKVQRMIPLLATVASSAPLLGLFGTVLGIMRAFMGIAQGGTSNIGAVAPGIAEALIATAAGLGAAIPAVVAYNVFTSRAQRLEGELERVAQDTIGQLGREGDCSMARLGGHGRARRTRHLNADVNIINLVDVMLVLLIIFMVTAPILQGGIQVRLPKAIAKPLDTPEAMTVNVDKGGRVALGDHYVSYDQFRATFKATVDIKRPSSVVIRADAGATWQDIARVLGVVRAAGIEKVGLPVEPVPDQ